MVISIQQFDVYAIMP